MSVYTVETPEGRYTYEITWTEAEVEEEFVAPSFALTGPGIWLRRTEEDDDGD